METNNKEKKLGVFMYEFLGTAFIMNAFMLIAAYANGKSDPTQLSPIATRLFHARYHLTVDAHYLMPQIRQGSQS